MYVAVPGFAALPAVNLPTLGALGVERVTVSETSGSVAEKFIKSVLP